MIAAHEAAALALGAALIATVSLAGARPGGPASAPPVAVTPAVLLADRMAYLGVSCPPLRVSDPRCDRVGLAVWLRRPARGATATIAGRALALDDPTWSYPLRHGRRRMLAGFLRPAGLRDGPLRIPSRDWIGSPEISAPVTVTADFGGGVRLRTRLTVQLSPGWG